ncbi:HlyD family efflux transporter periplasmic adaptor subunit [uncultured Cohaesibacter sp.]|uniref:HlyD family efflux transporter periplasmic adaptor subunit n=1 Tax=uncultured Cohaesibacter sp. TaxID=1002546 RepID=UPI0029C93DF5|nr:HlyD family efflux transporter periplasmic adaptor subunit [uncultured Cohaesibacter sp.]
MAKRRNTLHSQVTQTVVQGPEVEEKPEIHLPTMREDLVLYPRSRDKRGAPCWSLHDPVRNQFFYITWPAFEILLRWRMGYASKIAQDIENCTSLECDEEMVVEVAQFLQSNQLVESATDAYTDHLLTSARKRRVGWLNWLLHHYLFFRIPLVHPNGFLEATIKYVRWIGSRWFSLLSGVVFFLALILTVRQWSTFSRTFVDNMSLSGFLSFAACLVFAKIFHEFGHAYTAKSYGCKVPTMGVAFLVTWPVLYTDVNDSWKLPDHKQRLLISGAGVGSELLLAVWSTFLWAWLPDGTPIRTALFLLATTTWISSVAINLSPFMRFDGYFLLMDLLDMPNLHQRSFAIARWQIRELLFDLGEDCPEEMSRRRRIGLTLFAFAVWAYRLAIFLGIALIVYHFVVKIVGIFLFAIEIWWFVIMPVLSELRTWIRLAPVIRKRRRSLLTFCVFVVLVAIGSIPWNSRILAPAIQKTEKAYDVYVPLSAVLKDIDVVAGQEVKKGDILARFESPVIDQRLQSANQQIETLSYELSATHFNADYRKRSKSLQEEMKTAEAEKRLAEETIARLTLRAPFDGAVADLSPEYQPGQWISSSDRLMIIRSTGQSVLDAFVREEDLPRIKPSDDATFMPEDSAKRYKVTVSAIAPLAIRSLPVLELASINGGDIDTRKEEHALIPERALYQVRLTGEALPYAHSRMRGDVVIYGEKESLLGRFYRAVLVVLLREAGI